MTAPTLTAAIRQIRAGRDVAATGIGGALEAKRELVWQRWWCWQCRFSRFGVAISFRLYPRKLDVYDWLREYFPRLKLQSARGLHKEHNPPHPLHGRRVVVVLGRRNRGRKA